MSVSNHPTGIHRPTGDVENPYFRAWALRTSEGSSSSDRGAITTSLSASPKCTTAPLASPQGKRRRAQRHSFLSEGSTPVIYSPLVIPGIPTSTAPSNLKDDSGPSEDRSSSLRQSISESQNSRKSSLTARAQKLFGISHLRTREDTDKDEPPLPESRKEHQLKRGSAGSWVEGYLGKKRPSVDKVEAVGHESKDIRPQRSKDHHMPLTGARVRLKTPQQPQSPPEKTPPPPTAPKGGLYNLTKRALGIKKDSKAKDSAAHTERTTSQTIIEEMLDKTANALQQWSESGGNVQKRFETQRSTTSTSGLSITRQLLRSRLSGWSSSQSSTNSYLSIPPGKPPTSTPDPRSVYLGSDDREYLAVTLTDADGPTFLPSEAKRITTPPLFDRLQNKRKDRGFFFDFTPLPDKPGTPSGGAPEDAFAVERGRVEEKAVLPTVVEVPARKVPETDWYRAKLDAIDAEAEPSRDEFVLSVPEHLPNSPMCPRNPRHQSGGKGVCVYHGRNRSTKPRGKRM